MLSRGKIALENPDFLKRAPQEEVENRRQTLVQIAKKAAIACSATWRAFHDDRTSTDPRFVRTI